MITNCTNSSWTSRRCNPEPSSLTFASAETITGYSVIYGFISLVALIGNFLVCFVIIKNPGMRTVTNLFLLNLAVADILFIVVTVPTLLSMEIVPGHWLLGEMMCKIVPFLNTVTLSTSIYTMVLLAIDRYYAIMHPFRAKLQHTVRRTFGLITLIWVLSAAVASPQIPAQFYGQFEKTKYCIEEWNKHGGKLGKKVYSVAIFVIFFSVPITIIMIAYTTIIRRLRKTDGALKETFRANSERKRSREDKNGKIDEGSEGISRNNRKTTFMMFTVIVVFLVCMLPLNVFLLVTNLLSEQQQASNQEMIKVIYSIFNVLAVSSSACNPIIYNFFSLKFRRAFADVFRCKYKNNRHRSIAYNMSTEFNRL